MTTPTAREQQRRITGDVARLRIADGPLVGPLLWRVVSMMLARADWPLNRLDDALLVCDALCAHAPAYASEGCLSFSFRADEQEAELCVLDLSEDDAKRLIDDAMLPMVGNVLERVAERVTVEPGESGAGSQLVVLLSAG